MLTLSFYHSLQKYLNSDLTLYFLSTRAKDYLYSPFAPGLSKCLLLMVRQAHHKRSNFCVGTYYRDTFS